MKRLFKKGNKPEVTIFIILPAEGGVSGKVSLAGGCGGWGGEGGLRGGGVRGAEGNLPQISSTCRQLPPTTSSLGLISTLPCLEFTCPLKVLCDRFQIT